MAKDGKGVMKSVKGMAWMSSSIVVEYVFNLLTTYVLARLLTRSDYGEVAAITMLVGLADLLWQMGVGPALVQNKDATQDDYMTAQSLNILFGVIIFSVVNVFAGFWVNVFSIANVTMMRVYSIVFLLNSFIATPQAITQKKCDFKFLSMLTVSGTVFYSILVVVFAGLGFGPWSLVYSTVARYIYKLVMLSLKVRLKFSLSINKQSAKRLLHFGGGYTLAQIFNYIANNGDNFVVNKTLGKEALGTYNKVYALIGYPALLIGNTVQQVMFPILSSCQDDLKRIKKFFYTSTGVVAFLTVPVSVICYFCSEDLILFFLGKNWVSVTQPFSIMIMALFFRTAYKICDTILRSIGKVYHQFVIQVLYAVNIIGGAYIGHFYGLTAIAAYVTIAFMLNYVITTAVCMYFIKADIIEYIKSLAAPVFYGGIVTLMCVAVSEYISMIPSHFLVCAAWAVLVFTAYIVLYVLTRKKLVIADINQSVDTVIGSVLSKIKKK